MIYRSIANAPPELLNKRNGFTVAAERVGPGKHTIPESDEEYMFFHIRIYLQSSASGSDLLTYSDIDKVTYELHPTFKQRLRVSRDNEKQFEVRVWSYGFFKVNARVFTKWGQVFELTTLDNMGKVKEEERKGMAKK